MSPKYVPQRATAADCKRYPLADPRDVEILSKCKWLLSQDIGARERGTVLLIQSQLLDEWRAPLIRELNALVKKHERN